MDLFCVHKILGCIYKKILIPIKSIHWHWQLERDLEWDFWKDKDEKSDTNFLSHRISLLSTPLFENPLSTTSLPELQISPTNTGSTENPSLTQNPISLTPPTSFLLNPQLQKIEKPLMVTLCGQLSGLLNKKQIWKEDTFDQSTWRELS